MKLYKSILLMGLTAALMLNGFCAEKRKAVELYKVTLDMKKGETRSALRNATTGAPAQKGQWAKISGLYKSTPEWANEVTMKVFVLCYNKNVKKNKSGDYQGPYALLGGNVKYINIPSGKQNRGELFVHPGTLERFGDIREIRIELWYKGVLESTLMESFSSKKEKGIKNWWTQFPVREGELVNKYRAPFVFDPDNSPDLIKE